MAGRSPSTTGAAWTPATGSTASTRHFDDGVLHVTVFEGRLGDLPADTACIEIALLKSVTITLDQPIIAPSE